MSLTFRTGEAGDVRAVATLGSHSFPAVGYTLEQWEEVLRDSPRGGVETLWVGEEAGAVVAACRLYRFEQWIAGARVPTMGLGMVAISPTHRRRGLGARLVSTALRAAADRGDLVSTLYPFRTSFYRRLGYGMAGRAVQYHVPPATLPDHPARARVELADEPDQRAEIERVYARWAATQTGQVARDTRAWEVVWAEGTRHGILYRDRSGEAAGYAVIRYLATSPRGDRTVEVEEAAWFEEEGRRALYGWLASLADQWDRVLYRAHPDEGFGDYLSELRHPIEGVPRWHFWFPNAAVVEGPMFRILNVEGAWHRRPVVAAEPFAVALEVQDAELSANAGEWTLRMAAGGVGVERGAGAADVRIRLPIEVLSRLFIGAITAAEAARAGLLEADRPDALGALDRRLRVPLPWTFDRF